MQINRREPDVPAETEALAIRMLLARDSGDVWQYNYALVQALESEGSTQQLIEFLTVVCLGFLRDRRGWRGDAHARLAYLLDRIASGRRR